MQARLDGLLARNRRHAARDLVLAAIFPAALLLSGLGFRAELPKLAAARAVPAAAQTASAAESGAPCRAG